MGRVKGRVELFHSDCKRILSSNHDWSEANAICVMQLLLTDAMVQSGEEEAVEAAEILQNQIYYNGDILELSMRLMAGYKFQSIE